MRGTAQKVLTAHPTPSPACLVPSDVDSEADTTRPPTPPPRGRGTRRDDAERRRDDHSQNRWRSESGKLGSAVQPIAMGSDGTDGFVRDTLTSLAKRTVERVKAPRVREPAHSDGEEEPGTPSPPPPPTPPPNSGPARSGKKKEKEEEKKKEKKKRSRAPSPPSSYHSGSDSDEPEPRARAKSGTPPPDSPVRPKSRRENLGPAVIDLDEEHNYSERSYKSSSKKARKNKIDLVIA